MRIRKMFNHSDFGLWGEKQAQKHLKKKGLKILSQNFETSGGEIDIVCLQSRASAKRQAKDIEKQIDEAHGMAKFDLHKKLTQKHFECADNTLVFVEVKSRSKESANTVDPKEAVDAKKQNKYSDLAEFFVGKNKQFSEYPWRFDIVEVVRQNGKSQINHIEGAF